MKFNNEKVVPVKDYPKYVITEDGVVYDKKTRKAISPWIHEVFGYKSRLIQLTSENGRKHFKVHRLVAFNYLPPPESDNHKQINHKDGNSLNNHYTNLEWSTRSQNQRHAVETGLKGKGSSLYNSQLTEEQVHEICTKLKDKVLVKDLAESYGVSKDIIRKIKAGDTYFHIRQLYDLDHKYKNEYSESTIKWVCSQILEGYGDREIVENSTNPNLTIIEIKRIRFKIRYKYISDLYF